MERPTHAATAAHAPGATADKTMHVEKTTKAEDKKAVKSDVKTEVVKKETKKVDKKPKRHEVSVNGRNLGISTKESVAVCDYIRNKDVDRAIRDLEQVLLYKRAVPMRGEVPHRHGNMMAGRYPMNTVKQFIMLVKSLKSNALAHDMELEKYKITCMAHQAARPYKRFGQGKIKRSNVQMKLILRTMTEGGKK
ncbi:MAG: hypothetical protein RL557_433 [archaeon]|jgi:ribosomal protein L22